MRDLVTSLRPALAFTLGFALLLGLVYPLVVTGAARAVFPEQASGEILRGPDGRAVGSRLIGQMFVSPGYFQGRPSAAGNGYDPMSSGGSNLGPTSRALRDRVRADAARLGPGAPADLLTASGSGLDPDVTPEGARFQIARVASARGLDPRVLEELVSAHVRGPLAGLGEPRVNVLELNLDLDALPSRGPASRAGGR